jgi:hypothetical protein
MNIGDKQHSFVRFSDNFGSPIPIILKLFDLPGAFISFILLRPKS